MTSMPRSCVTQVGDNLTRSLRLYALLLLCKACGLSVRRSSYSKAHWFSLRTSSSSSGEKSGVPSMQSASARHDEVHSLI